jgi:hypothetical protein
VRVLFCGDRHWDAEYPIWLKLNDLPEGTIIVSGGARGADTLAQQVALNLGFEVVVYPAQWDKFGRSAGPIRNRQMADSGIDMCYAFHADITNSKGTADMLKVCRERGIPYELIER